MDKSEIAKQLGKLGGQATKKKHGPDYYKNIGKLGLKKRWAHRLRKKKTYLTTER